jgi:hypothetical protein
VPLLSLSALDVVKPHGVTCLAASHDVGPGPAPVDVVDVHGIADELRRGSRTHLNLGNVVLWVQRVVALPLRLEFDDLRGCSVDITRRQVGLVLVETNVEGARARTVNVPVLVRELLLLDLLASVKLGGSTFNRQARYSYAI